MNGLDKTLIDELRKDKHWVCCVKGGHDFHRLGNFAMLKSSYDGEEYLSEDGFSVVMRGPKEEYVITSYNFNTNKGKYTIITTEHDGMERILESDYGVYIVQERPKEGFFFIHNRNGGSKLTDGEKLVVKEWSIINIVSENVVEHIPIKMSRTKNRKIYSRRYNSDICNGEILNIADNGGMCFFVKRQDGKANGIDKRSGKIFFEDWADDICFKKNKCIDLINQKRKSTSTTYYAYWKDKGWFIILNVLGEIIPAVNCIHVFCAQGIRSVVELQDGTFRIYERSNCVDAAEITNVWVGDRGFLMVEVEGESRPSM